MNEVCNFCHASGIFLAYRRNKIGHQAPYVFKCHCSIGQTKFKTFAWATWDPLHPGGPYIDEAEYEERLEKNRG